MRESNNYRTETTYTANTVFRVAVVGGVVQYSKDGSVFYQSLISPAYPLMADASLLGTSASFANAMFQGGGGSSTQITVVQWNIHKGREECTDHPHSQCHNSLEEIAIYLATNNADVVSMNEVAFKRSGYVDSNGNLEDQPLALEQWLETKTGQCWERLFTNEDWPGSADVGNLLLWRTSDPDPTCTQAPGRFHKQSIYQAPLPSVRDGSRSVGGVTLIVGSLAVTFFTTHLCAPSFPGYNGCSPSPERQSQVNTLNDDAAGFTPPRVIAGDFNAGPNDSEIIGPNGMTVTYVDLWPQAVSAGTATGTTTPATTGQITNPNGNWRPDYIFKDSTAISLVSMKIESVQGVQAAVSDHYPVLATLTVQ